MIETFFGRDALGTPAAFVASLVIGLAFGFALERAGFGSARKLAGIFYLRDMTVLKVMFTAVITAMLGLGFLVGLGWIDLASQVNLLQTQYAAQILGGLIFGVGFVLGGWCPGTAAVGIASGKLDALVFLGGAVLGSIGFNETHGLWRSVIEWGAYEEPQFAFGLSKTTFGLLFTLVAVGAFHFAEWVERPAGGGKYLGTPFLKAFSLALVVFAVALFILPGQSPPSQRLTVAEQQADTAGAEQTLLADIDAAVDHIEPEDLADRLLRGEPDLMVVDVRSPAEYAAFHIPGATHVPLADLPAALEPHKNAGSIVLYSNGMTHPAQARDALARLGFQNVYLLTDGLQGFVDRCLKPVSLRDEPLSAEDAARVNAWRKVFLVAAESGTAAVGCRTAQGAACGSGDRPDSGACRDRVARGASRQARRADHRCPAAAGVQHEPHSGLGVLEPGEFPRRRGRRVFDALAVRCVGPSLVVDGHRANRHDRGGTRRRDPGRNVGGPGARAAGACELGHPPGRVRQVVGGDSASGRGPAGHRTVRLPRVGRPGRIHAGLPSGAGPRRRPKHRDRGYTTRD